jgi:hypothetical protein
MKLAVLFSLLLIMLGSCNKGQGSEKHPLSGNIHEVVVKEVLQTNQFIYVRAIENQEEVWLALPGMNVIAGQTYYYRDGFRLTDFESKDLKRKFPVIYYIETLSTSPDLLSADTLTAGVQALSHHNANVDTAEAPAYTAKVSIEKVDVELPAELPGTKIADLYADARKYEGKTVKVYGKITKYNPKILGNNWIHIQDGSEFNGKFDLTATTSAEFSVGTTVWLEGTISLNRDFGYGYKYDILLENARLLDKK